MINCEVFMHNWPIKYKVISLIFFILFLFTLWNSALLLFQEKWLDSMQFLAISFMLPSIILTPEIFFLTIREGMEIHQPTLSQRTWVQRLNLIGIIFLLSFAVLKLLQ